MNIKELNEWELCRDDVWANVTGIYFYAHFTNSPIVYQLRYMVAGEMQKESL